MSDSDVDIDFGDTASDTEFVTSVLELNKALKLVDRHVTEGEKFSSLTDPEESIDRDLFALFALNSLFWINLRLQGIDPSAHPVRHHLQKVRDLMTKKKEIIDKRNRPTLNKAAAARFIKHGLWKPADSSTAQNKKIKFNDD